MTTEQTFAPALDAQVPLMASAPNFRDLGGYATDDGGRVRRGMIFRSGQLSKLTDPDMAAIAAYGIRCVIDLRTTDEREAQPARWGGPPPESFGSAKRSLASEMMQILDDVSSVEGARRGFAAFYARIPEIYADEYRLLFNKLADAPLPLLVKCTAGKDRTGVGSALILSALGVSRETVVADYAETAARLPAIKALRGDAPVAGEAQKVVARRAMSAEVRDAIWEADPANLIRALETVDAQYGSVERYVVDRLGVAEDRLDAIRERLIERP